MKMDEVFEENESQLRYFNITPSEVAFDFEELVNEVISKHINTLGETTSSLSPDEKGEITNVTDSLTEMYKTGAKDALKKFKETITEILFLPPTLILPDYLPEDVVSIEEVEQLEKEVVDLENEFKKQIYYKNVLQNVLKNFEGINHKYQTVESLINSHHHLSKNNTSGESGLFHLAENLNSYRRLYAAKKGAFDATKDDVVDHFGLFKTE